jgi:hypothetical protein
MTFGRYRGRTIVDLWNDESYCEWLAGQDWFAAKFRTHYIAVKLRPSQCEIDRLAAEELERERGKFQAVRAERAERQRERLDAWIELEREEQARTEAAAPPGSMPFRKHKGEPLACVIRDRRYMHYLRGMQTSYRERYDGLEFYPETMARLDAMTTSDASSNVIPFPRIARRHPAPSPLRDLLGARGRFSQDNNATQRLTRGQYSRKVNHPSDARRLPPHDNDETPARKGISQYIRQCTGRNYGYFRAETPKVSISAGFVRAKLNSVEPPCFPPPALAPATSPSRRFPPATDVNRWHRRRNGSTIKSLDILYCAMSGWCTIFHPWPRPRSHPRPPHASTRRPAPWFLRDDPKGPLFRTIGRGTAKLTRTVLPQANAYAMIRRRAAAAGIATKLGNHSFRATGITAYLKNGGTLEKAAAMVNHASTRTTQLYDRRSDKVSLDEVERIVI